MWSVAAVIVKATGTPIRTTAETSASISSPGFERLRMLTMVCHPSCDGDPYGHRACNCDRYDKYKFQHDAILFRGAALPAGIVLPRSRRLDRPLATRRTPAGWALDKLVFRKPVLVILVVDGGVFDVPHEVGAFHGRAPHDFWI